MKPLFDVTSFTKNRTRLLTTEVARVRKLGVTAHVAATDHCSAIDGRATRHGGFGTSHRRRKLIEEGYGWMKTVGGLAKLRHRGKAKVSATFTFTCSADSLTRL